MRVMGKRTIQRFNDNHAANGQFGTGSGTTDPSGTLSAAELSHVSGNGTMNGSTTHTVSVGLTDGSDHQTMAFTDSFVAGDAQTMLTSDHAYVFHGSASVMQDVETEFGDHPDSGLYTSNSGKTVLFTNQELSDEQLSTATENLGASVDQYSRDSGAVGTYGLQLSVAPGDFAQSAGGSRTKKTFARAISVADRAALAEEDFGDPANRDFPIRNQHDLENAAHLIGKAGPGVKERIEQIAKRKGLTLPASWQAEEDDSKGSEEQRMAGKVKAVDTAGQPTDFSFYAPFVRVADKESDKREVLGKATRGTIIDTYGTIITYEGSKSAFSRAKRIPLREMHQNKAVGKGLEWWGDDKGEEIFLHSYISRAADDTWTKVEEDILVGYSIKGANAKYGTIQRDGKTIPAIVDYDLVEVSLVDNPSCPGCDIAIMRGDGIEPVIASDEEMAEVLHKEQTPAQPSTIERVGASMSAANVDKLHTVRDSAMQMCADNGCLDCAAMLLSMAGDPNNDDGDDIGDQVERAMAPVYSRMQAYLGEFARRQSDVLTLSGAIAQLATKADELTTKVDSLAAAKSLDKVRQELSDVKGQIERIAATPTPGGPHTGRTVHKSLATDAQTSGVLAEETPDVLMKQITASGVQLTASQQAQLIAGSLKRM